MKAKLLVVLFFMLGFANNLYSQSFNLYSIDTSNFPNMRALFYARTPMGADYPNIVPADFDFYENGVNLNSTLGVDCKKVDFYPQLAVVLVLDVSTSMSADAGNGEKRIDWVKQGAFAFLDSIKLDPPSVIGFVLFAGDVYKTSPLYDTKPPLYDWLNVNLTINAGSTDFYPPFVKNYPPLGALPLLETAPKDLRRVVIFLTDGEPERPFQNWKVDTVISYAKRIKTQVYSIFITSPLNTQIDWICQNTGGKSFSVYTKSALISAFRQIVGDIQSRNVCYLTWVSPYGCDEQSRARNIKAIFKRIPDSVTTDYFAPTSSIAKLSVSENQLLFGLPGIGITTRQLTLKAENSDFTISNYTLSTTGKFAIDLKGKTLPFTLLKGQNHTIEISYIETPPGSSTETIFQIISSPCNPEPLSLIAPCGGETIKEVNFGKVVVSSAKNLPQSCAFRNTTVAPIDVTLSIEGSDSNQFKVIGGTGPFHLQPNECLDVIVQFSPSSVGLKSASLKYNIPTFCGEHFTNLLGEGIPSSLPIGPVDFGVKRIFTINDTSISIINSTPTPIIIEKISLSNTNDNNFTLLNLPSFPITLNENDTLNFNIRYNPLVEGYLENPLQIEVKDFPESVVVPVFGIGGLPKIDAPDVDCGKTKVGNTITGQIVITNKSNSMDLTIKEVTLSSTTEFKFGTGAVTQNIVVPKNNGTFTIPIDFTPISTGKRSCFALIKSDAAPGPNPNPIVNDTLEIFGYGEGLIATPDPMDFGEISTCAQKEVVLEIDNTMFPIEMMINSINISGTDRNNFQVVSFPNRIQANSKGNVLVRFIPTSGKTQFRALLDIESSNGNKSIELIGKAFVENVKVDYKLNQNKFEINKDLNLSFEANITKNHNLPINQVLFEFKVPRKNFNLKQFNSDLVDYSWKIDSTIDGYVVTGNGSSINTPVKIICDAIFETYLSNVSTHEINVLPKFPELDKCLIPTDNPIKINLVTCFTEGRLVEVSNKFYKLAQISPNPVVNDFDINIEIGFDDLVELSICNYLGEKVLDVFNGNLKAGNYFFYIKSNDFSNGIYFVRIRTNSYSAIEPFVILK